MKENQVLTSVVERIVEKLNEGICPWQKPWKESKTYANGLPLKRNYVSGRCYDLLNQLLLSDVECLEFITFKQIQALKGKLKKGAKSYPIYSLFKTQVTAKVKTTDNDGNEIEEEHTWNKWNFKYYQVFAIDDVEGITSKIPTEPTAIIDDEQKDSNTIAEEVIANYLAINSPLKLHKGSNTAFYAPRTDEVCVPSLSQYKCKEEYYSTLFHELTHSSGAEKRCNRKGITDFDHFGSTQYSAEELIAEMGAAFALAILGIDSEKAFNNSVAYLQSWAKHLKDNPTWIIDANLGATKAIKYIFKGSQFEDILNM